MSTSTSPETSFNLPPTATRAQTSDSVNYMGDRREELTETLRSRLIECGWRDKVASMCRDLIHKHGVEEICFERIIGEVRPQARLLVPDQIKTDMLEVIRKLDKEQSLSLKEKEQSNVSKAIGEGSTSKSK